MPSEPQFDAAETETDARRKATPSSPVLASVFDNLIASNLALSQSVGRLVRLSWAIILLNVVLIASVAVTLTWAAVTR